MCIGKCRKLRYLIWESQRGKLQFLRPISLVVRVKSGQRSAGQKLISFILSAVCVFSSSGFQQLERIKQISAVFQCITIYWCLQLLIFLFILNTYFRGLDCMPELPISSRLAKTTQLTFGWPQLAELAAMSDSVTNGKFKH